MKEQLDELIKQSMKDRTTVRTLLLRDIKSEFSKAESAKNFKELDELAILKSMKKRREESVEKYARANRLDLADIEQEEITILEEFLPQEATIEEMVKAIEDIKSSQEDHSIGGIMKKLKIVLPHADMKRAIDIVKSLNT